LSAVKEKKKYLWGRKKCLFQILYQLLKKYSSNLS
jgi:hypothetical protein